MLQASAGGGSGGGRSERVGNVVASTHVQLDRGAAHRRGQPEVRHEALGADRGAYLGGLEVGRLLHPERHDARRRQTAPQARKLIIRVDDRRRAGRETLNHLAFGARHTLQAAEALEVLRARIRDHADRRPCDAYQAGDLACPIGAHLHDREAMRGLETQHREGHADVVVEIAAGGEAAARLSENRCRHLLGRRLAVAAGDTHQRTGERLAPALRGALERRLRVRHDDLGELRGLLLVHQRAGCAGRHGRAHEFVAVEARAVQRDEQLARRERARVARDTRVRPIGSVQPTATGLGKGC